MKKQAVFLLAALIVFAVHAFAADIPPSITTSSSPDPVFTSVTITAVANDQLDNAGLVEIKLFEDGILARAQNCLGKTTCTATKSFTYPNATNHSYYATAKDNGGNIATSQALNITFLGPNTKPLWSGLQNASVLEDSGFNNNLTNLTAFAVDNQTSSGLLNYTITNQTNTSLVTCSIDPNNFFDCNVTAVNSSGISNVTLVVDDGLLNDTTTITITVVEVNDPPARTNQSLPSISLAEDAFDDSLNLSEFFLDVDGPASLSYSFISNPNVTATTAQVNTTTVLLNLTASNNFTGIFNLTITASDSLNSTNDTLFVNVTPVNDPPQFSPQPSDVTAELGLLFTLDINATDIDDLNETFTFFDNTTTFVINASSGLINFTPSTIGNESVEIIVCDSSGAANNCTVTNFTLETKDTMPPTIIALTEPTSPSVFAQNASYAFGINLSDANGLGTVVLTFNNQNFTATNTTTTFFTANASNQPAGNHSYAWTFSDAFNNTNTSTTQNFTILPANSSINLTLDGVDGNITVSAGSGVTAFSALLTPTSGIIDLLQNNATISSSISPLNITLNFSTSTAGVFNITARFAGNQNYTASEDTHFINVLDLIPPTPGTQNASPALPATYAPGQNYTFTINWTDNFAISTATLEFDKTNFTTTNTTPDVYTTTLTDLAAGNHSYKWFANDTSNNINSTTTLNYTILPAPSTLNLTITPGTTVTFGTSTTASCSVDNAQLTPSLTRNSTPVSNPDTATLAVGSYNYTCTASSNQNYTSPAPTSQTLTVNPAPAIVNLTLNGIDDDISVAENSTVNITGILVSPSSGNISLFVNGTLINTGSSPLFNATNFNISGAFLVEINFSGSTNFSPASKTHFVIVGTGLVKFNFSPPTNSLLNQSFANFSMNTNINTSCRWDANDLGYDNMTNNFSITGGTTHATTVTGFSLGQNTFSAGCVNDTTITNQEITYNVTNIIENSSIGTASITNSIVRFINISPTTTITNSNLNTGSITNSALSNVSSNTSTINDSVLTNCVVTNSTVKNITASDCNFVNSFVDPSNLTGSSISDSDITNSNVTFSNVTNSTISDSNTNFSTITNSIIKNNTFLDQGTLTDSVLSNSNFVNASISNNSSLNGVNGTNVVINNNVLTSGNVTLVFQNSPVQVNATSNLSEWVNVPPTASFTLSPGSTITVGQSVTFNSTSTDPNIGTQINDSLTLLWQFSDGANSTNNTVVKTFSTTGTFPFNLTATDNFNESSTASGTITVNPQGGSGGRGSGGGGGGSGGGGGALFGRVFKINLSENKTRIQTASRLDTLMLEHNGTLYPMENFQISRDGVNFTITGKAYNYVNNEVRKINLDNDKYYDVSILFSKNFVTRAEFTFTPLHELIPGFAEAPPAGVVVEKKEKPSEEQEPVEQPPTLPEKEKEEPVKEKIRKEFFASLLDAIKKPFGKPKTRLQFESTDWLVTLAVIVFGLLLYAIISRLTD